jgi:hypothetical protein
MPFLAGFLKIIKISGENFYFYVWLFMYGAIMGSRKDSRA